MSERHDPDASLDAAQVAKLATDSLVEALVLWMDAVVRALDGTSEHAALMTCVRATGAAIKICAEALETIE